MRLVVCVKWSGTLGDDVEFVDNDQNVDPDYLDFALNEWDRYAVEEALRLREAVAGSEVIALTVGSKEADSALVQCLAMGVDQVTRIPLRDSDPHDPVTVGRLLAAALQPTLPDLVLCGAQSSDAAHGATGCALAAWLSVPCVTMVSKIDLELERNLARVKREIEGGLVDVVEVLLPAVLTIQTGINEPRYVTLRAVQQARLRGIKTLEVEATALNTAAYRVRRMYLPEKAGAERIPGGPKGVAAKIMELVREAAS